MALTLDPARWVPLKDRADQLHARLRWAIGLAVVLALVLGGAAAWWWASSEEPPPTDEAIEVERIEAEGAAPSSKPSPPPQPPQPKK
jgi:type IV secretory pathway VirB10-like protein